MNMPWEWSSSTWALTGAMVVFPIGPLVSNLLTLDRHNDVNDLCRKLLLIVVIGVLCMGAGIAQGVW